MAPASPGVPAARPGTGKGETAPGLHSGGVGFRRGRKKRMPRHEAAPRGQTGLDGAMLKLQERMRGGKCMSGPELPMLRNPAIPERRKESPSKPDLRFAFPRFCLV